MKSKKRVEFLKTMKILSIFLVVMCAIATFAGCLNYAYVSGEAFYWIPCLVTAIIFGILYYKDAKEDLDSINICLKEAEEMDKKNEESDDDL